MGFVKFSKKNEPEEISPPEPQNGITEIKRESATVLIYLYGKIDANNCENIESAVFDLIEKEKIKELYFDMDSVTYVSSAGLRMFFAINQRAAELNITYKLLKMREDILKLFQLTGYASAFYIEPKE